MMPIKYPPPPQPHKCKDCGKITTNRFRCDECNKKIVDNLYERIENKKRREREGR